MIEKIVKNVMELHGVDGACILDKKGNLLHNALPDFFLNDYLDDLSRRIKALYEAVDENYMPCDDYLLKFPQKFIQIRRSRNVYLLVSVDPSVNLVSLRMVTNLVLKHITPKVLSEMRKHLEAKSITKPETIQEAPEVAPTLEPTQVEAPTPKEAPMTRGNRVARPRPTRSFRGTSY